MNTQFNPFGAQENAVNSVKVELAQVIGHVEKESASGKGALSQESKSFGSVMEKLTSVCKEIDETAIQPLLSEFITPLSQFARLLSTSADKLKPADVASLCRSMAKFIQIVADRIVEPFGSDLLEQWAPFFEALFVSAKSSILLRDMGVILWKSTFGTVKGSLRYPGELRQSLEKLPKKNGIILPPEEKKSTDPIIFDGDEEEAMDGMGTTSTSVEKEEKDKVEEDSQNNSTFPFSQQSAADAIAEKLLREAKMKEEKEKEKEMNKKETPSRRRASKISLLDEDSCDFIPITTTPPSSRRSRLTERQKEKLAEALGPRTTTNYVDEESQSGFQKRIQMTEALNKLNYDVGEDSVSVLIPPSPKLSEKSAETVSQKTKTEESTEKPPTESQNPKEEGEQKFESPPGVAISPETPPKSARRSSKRARRLFDDRVKNVINSVNLDKKMEESADNDGNDDGDGNAEEKKKVEKKVEFVGEEEIVLKHLKEDSEEVAVDSPRKTRGRPKGIPKKSESTPHPKKRTRSSVIKKELDLLEEVSEQSPNAKKLKDAPEEPPKLLEKAAEVESIPLCCSSEISKDLEVETLETVQKAPESPEKMETFEKSPPKTPRTPSILRVGKRAASDVSSPMTERKRNRVHFNEDSLPLDVVSSSASPQTPRRSQVVLAVDVKSPPKMKKSSEEESTEQPPSTTDNQMGLLEISDPSSSTSPFFKNLVGCQDPIEKVVRKLAPLCLKTAVDAVKKSLQKAGVKTIGEFASLSRRQLNDIAGLKHPKEKCARSVLAEYEATKKEEQRASEERITAGKEAEMPSEERHFEPIPKIAEISKSLPEVAEIRMEEIPPAEQSTEKFEKIPEIFSATQSETPTDENAEKASQSPASPVKSTGSESSSISMKSHSEEVRKNLAPIFDKARVKKEFASPQKQDISGENQMKVAVGKTMVDDARLLHKISSNLSRAHSLNQLPSEKWTNLLDTINKSAILFKNIVQERGALLDEWDDLENNENCQEISSSSPEDEVKCLRGVYRRFSRHHSIGDVPNATWQKVMESVNEAALLLRSIVVERAPRC